MKRGITIKDIAKKLNMSISTVSKALNNDATISMLTKERVQEMAKRVNYVPNEAARNFKLSKTYTVGLIIPDLLDQFFVLAINGVEEIAEQEKYNVILAQSHEDVAKEEKIMKVMIRNRVDGVIAVITKNTVDMQLFQHLESMGIPIVFIAREPSDKAFNYVITKNEEGSFLATEVLIKNGHKRIAHIMGPTSLHTSSVRLQGYKNALEKYGLPFDESLVKEVDFSQKDSAKAMEKLVSLASPPTAVNTFKTYIALDAIEYLRKNQPDLVDKIEFVGFGNLPMLHYLDHKPIASIEENSYEMGEEAAKLLFKMIQEIDLPPENPVHHEVNCKLVMH